MKDKAIVLMYYGFPSRRDEMFDYLKDILHGRDPPPSLVEENLRKLDAIGGETPSIRIIESLKNKIEKVLGNSGFNTYLLSKHYKPSIKDSSGLIKEEIIYEVPLFPVYSKQIFDDYFIPLESALGKREFHRVVNIGLHQKIINYFKEKMPSTGLLSFSAHSIPIKGYDPYPQFIVSLAKIISEGRKHMIFYHSQGPYSPKWLGPDMDYVLEYMKRNELKKIAVIPIGFLYEHLEVLYDLDYTLRKKLENSGIEYWRAGTPNDDDVVVEAILDIINA